MRLSIRRDLLHKLREQFRGSTVLDMILEGTTKGDAITHIDAMHVAV
jgi:hypothetical protein